MIRDSQIIRIFRYTALALIGLSVIYLFFYPTEAKWIYLLAVWTLLAISLAVSRFRVYRRININFQRIEKRAGGTVNKGSYIFASPPCIKFRYLNRTCRICHSTDTKLDFMIEYIYPVDVEIEFRLTHRKVRLKDKHKDKAAFSQLDEFHNKYIVTGQEKNLIYKLIKHPRIIYSINALMKDFQFFYIGKDGNVRLLAYYDSYLTDPEKVFSVFYRIISIVDFIESKVKSTDNETHSSFHNS